jgi:DNA invertase Pin-like site-specific DNA recombinase
MKAIIYARFSSDKQRESSIEDQANICKVFAEREGFQVLAVYTDEGISGSTPVHTRSGGAKLLADAVAERFDVLILEGLDRLSRDQVEQEQIVRRFEHRGIVILGVADGYDSRMGGRKIMRGVRGLINELYLDDLRHKTHRGQSGQVDRGFVAGGKSYGYDIIKTETGSTYQVNESQAETVRFIFEQYASGSSAQKIASMLNSRGIKSPRHNSWAVSAIYGNRNKGSGILNNSLYIGQYVWNRSQWIKDPDSGKRQRFERKKEEWKTTDAPQLRIISDELWNAVQARTAPKKDGGNAGAPARTLFGGLLTCPHCGGAVIAINSKLYGCNTRKDRGAEVCQGIMIPRDQTDARLLSIIKQELLSPEAIAQIETEVKQFIGRNTKESDTAGLKAKIAELDSTIERLIDAISAVGISEGIKLRLTAAEKERAKLRDELDRAAAPAILPSVLSSEIRAQIKRITIDLQSTLKSDTQAARRILSELFGKIQITEKQGSVYAEYDNATERLLMSVNGVSLNVVAGAGFINKKRRILLYER